MLLEKVLDRRGSRRLAAIERLRAHHETVLSEHADAMALAEGLPQRAEIQHLRQESTEQWRTIRAILADKKKLEKQLLELKHP